MGLLGRPNKRTPVSVRRVPEIVDIPGAAPPPGPAPAAGPVGNTFVYVAMPAAGPQQHAPQQNVPPPQPPAAPGAPAQVHYHTNVYSPDPRRYRSRASRTGTSFFGAAGFVLAAAAGGIAFIPKFEILALPVGLIALGLGFIGLVFSSLFGRSGGGLPVAAMLFSLIAMFLGLGGRAWVSKMTNNFAPGLLNSSPAPAGSSARPAPIPPAVPFSPAPSAPPLTPPPSPRASVDAPPSPARPAPVNTTALERSRAALADATARLESLLANDTIYQQAKADYLAADAKVKSLRATEPIGSPDLATASQQWMAAQDRLSTARLQAAARDPAIAAALKSFTDAQAAVSAAGGTAPRGGN
jgi:hypothetical protein